MTVSCQQAAEALPEFRGEPSPDISRLATDTSLVGRVNRLRDFRLKIKD
ncbi:hypothetical protein QUA86_30370 [Microcoleus sp. F6_B6]